MIQEDPEDAVLKALFGDDKKHSEKSEKKKENNREKKEKKKETKKESEKTFHFMNLFGGKRGKREQQQMSLPEPQPREDVPEALETYFDVDDEKTTIMDDSNFYMPMAGHCYMELLHSPFPEAPQRLELNFTRDYLTIGRETKNEMQPDIAFPGSMRCIGRRHARMEKRGDSYFIIDLGTVNHTCLNGKVMMPNQPYELSDGDEVAFTDVKPIRYRMVVKS